MIKFGLSHTIRNTINQYTRSKLSVKLLSSLLLHCQTSLFASILLPNRVLGDPLVTVHVRHVYFGPCSYPSGTCSPLCLVSNCKYSCPSRSACPKFHVFRSNTFRSVLAPNSLSNLSLRCWLATRQKLYRTISNINICIIIIYCSQMRHLLISRAIFNF